MNTHAGRVYGHADPTDMSGRLLGDYMPEPERARVLAINQSRERGLPAPTSYDTKGLRLDGTIFDAEISASTYTIDGRQFIVIVCGGGKNGAPSGSSIVAFALPVP